MCRGIYHILKSYYRVKIIKSLFYNVQVNNGEIENSEPITFLEFEGVPKEKAESIPELLKISLEQHLMDFDKARMDNCLKASIQEELSAMENNPHGSLQYACIADFLFGRSDPKMVIKI